MPNCMQDWRDDCAYASVRRVRRCSLGAMKSSILRTSCCPVLRYLNERPTAVLTIVTAEPIAVMIFGASHPVVRIIQTARNNAPLSAAISLRTPWPPPRNTTVNEH